MNGILAFNSLEAGEISGVFSLRPATRSGNGPIDSSTKFGKFWIVY